MPGLWPYASSNASLGAGIWAYPTVLSAPVTVASMQLEVHTAGAAASNWMFGIYDRDRLGYPHRRIYGSTAVSVDLTTPAVYGVTGLSRRLSPGLYWFVLAMQDLASVKNMLCMFSPVHDVSGNNTPAGTLHVAMSSHYISALMSSGLPIEFSRTRPSTGTTAVAEQFLSSAPRLLIGV
jgi:hypothetical protein